MLFSGIFSFVLYVFGLVFDLLPSGAQYVLENSFLVVAGYGVYLLGESFTTMMLGACILELTGFTTFWTIEYIWKRCWS